MNLRESIAAAKKSGPTPQGDGLSTFEFQFSQDDPVFKGHFPVRPLLPGVFQLEMTRAAAEWLQGCPFEIREVSRAKFLRPIAPEELIRLDLKLTTTDASVQARARFFVGGEAAGETALTLWPRA